MGEVTLVPPAPVPPAPIRRHGGAWKLALIRFYWLAPALLTLALGLWRARQPALWADELATWSAVRLSWSQLWQLLGNVDAAVAPYYVLLKIWTGLAGTGDLALRLPSIMAMTCATALVAVLGARLAGGGLTAPTAAGRDLGATTAGRDPGAARRRAAGLVAGLLFAVVPATSRYAQEARPYAGAILLACLATLALVWLVGRPGPARATCYALCIVLLGAAHLVAVLLILAHAVTVLWLRRRQLLVAWSVGTAVALLALLPLAVIGVHQRGQINWIPALDWRTPLDVPETIFATGAVGGAVIALAALSVSRRPAVVALLSWALVPPAALLLIALVHPLFWARYLLFTMPAWVLLAARTLSRLPLAKIAVAWLAVLAVGVPTQMAIREPAGHDHATSAIGGIITANERPGDAFVVAQNEQPEPWEARDIVARYVPAARRPLDVFAVTPQRTDGRLLATECADLTACLDRADPARIWVIRFEARPDPLALLGQPKADLLRSRYRTEKVWLVRGLTVALLVRADSKP